MGFFTPWFLAGAGRRVGLPVWLHLLRKHKTTPLPFSSLMFFERRMQSSIKHRRLRYLVLFALRTALILLIALAFAQPYVRQAAAPASAHGRSHRAGHRQLAQHARRQPAGPRPNRWPRRMVAGLRPGERAQVLAFGSRVQAMSEVTDDHAPLNAAIDAIESLRRAHVLRGTGALAALHRAIAPPAAAPCTSIPTCSRPACRPISTISG